MTGEHKSYGFEGGYEDWNSGKVFSNMRLNREDASFETNAPNEPDEVVTETSTDNVEEVENDTPDIDVVAEVVETEEE